MTASRLGLADSWGSIQSIRFNQDSTAFAVSLDSGLRVFNVDPLRELSHYGADKVGSIARAEMLFRTNLLAVVSTSHQSDSPSSSTAAGGGPASSSSTGRPLFADNAVMIFDAERDKFRMEFTFPSKVLSVRLKRDKLVAVCRDHITVFSFPHRPKKLFSISTRDNPRGLCEVSPMRLAAAVPDVHSEFMVFPGYKLGSLQIVDLATTEHHVSSAPVTINAHQNAIWCVAVNHKGTMIATASTKGTLIRIWDAAKRLMLAELRRGTDQALLYCINFSPRDEWICCSSDKGTVHIFALQDYRLNRRSTLATIGVPGAYAGSQWSLTSFTVPQEVACICAFDSGSEESSISAAQGTIFAACLDGSFHKYHFSADGQCNQVAYDVFTEMCEDCGWDVLRK